jgi:hypothetical protein
MTAKPTHGAPPSSSATELGISVLLQSTIAIDDQQNGICGRLAAHDVEHLPITVKPLRRNGTHATHTTAESAISNHRDGLAASPTSVGRQGQVGRRDDRLRRTYPGARSTAAGSWSQTRQSDALSRSGPPPVWTTSSAISLSLPFRLLLAPTGRPLAPAPGGGAPWGCHGRADGAGVAQRLREVLGSPGHVREVLLGPHQTSAIRPPRRQLPA